MKHLKIFALVVVLPLLALSCTKQAGNINSTDNANVESNVNSDSANVNANTNTNSYKSEFSDATTKVDLNYTGLNMVTTPKEGYITSDNLLGNNTKTLLTLYLDPKIYVGTNLETAWFNLAVRDGATISQAQCYAKPTQGNISAFTNKRVVQGNVWYYPTPNPLGDAAAGHSGETETYHLFKNNMCYEARLGLSGFNRQNLENPNSVKEYNASQIFQYLGAAFNKLKVN